jgi:hypothetical protein
MIFKARFTLGLQTKKPLAQFNSLVWFLVINKKFELVRFMSQRCSIYFKTGDKFGHLFWNYPHKISQVN